MTEGTPKKLIEDYLFLWSLIPMTKEDQKCVENFISLVESYGQRRTTAEFFHNLHYEFLGFNTND